MITPSYFALFWRRSSLRTMKNLIQGCESDSEAGAWTWAYLMPLWKVTAIWVPSLNFLVVPYLPSDSSDGMPLDAAGILGAGAGGHVLNWAFTYSLLDPEKVRGFREVGWLGEEALETESIYQTWCIYFNIFTDSVTTPERADWISALLRATVENIHLQTPAVKVLMKQASREARN